MECRDINIVRATDNPCPQTFFEKLGPIGRNGRRGLVPLFFIFVGTAALVGPGLSFPKIRLIWNARSSVPRGLYLIGPAATLRRGDMFLSLAPANVRRLAAPPHY